MRDPLEEASEEVTRPKAAVLGVVILVGLVALFVARPGARIPLLVVAGIVGMVMLHELGHFLTARRAGMKVTEFFLGFGPRVWSFRRGETEYGVKAIPAGGYVRIVGMNNLDQVDPADEDRTFRSKPFRARFTVVVAGVAMNLLLAFVLLFVAFAGQGRAVGPSTTVATVGGGTPAAEAGIRAGDRLVSVEGIPIDEWRQLPAALHGRVEESTTIVVERGGQERPLTAVPLAREDNSDVGCLGVAPTTDFEPLGLGGAGREAGTIMVTGSRDTAVAIGRLVSPAGVSEYSRNFTEDRESGGACAAGATERPISLIGIVSLGSDLVGENLWQLLFLLAVINLLLALFNMIPLLPFDGGHAAIAAYEAVNARLTGRPGYRADYRKMVPVSAAVLILFLALGLSAAFLDVRDLFN